MKVRRFSLGLILALAVMPICAAVASPRASECGVQVLSLWQPEPWRMEPIQVREKRPELNPARAALRI